MSDDSLHEVYRALRDAQMRYAYFLLAASGAAIGLAVNQTRTAALRWAEMPLGVAVTMWGLSFFFGCRHLAYVGSTLYANVELLRVQRGKHPDVGSHPEMIAAASDGIRAGIQTNADRGSRYARWQFRLLIAGALFYLAWHVGQMYLRTIHAG